MMLIFVILLVIPHIYSLPSLNLLQGKDGYLIQEYINAIHAYGPGLGVYSPYSYVDISYDNIPFVGKIPVFGKEGTSSRLGISPFYPPQGNPSNPFPPIYRARPLPLHVPEPQDVVAVPLDEEALHGEPLFPPELSLPGDKAEEMLSKETNKIEKPVNPFAEENNIEFGAKEGVLNWPENPTAESTMLADVRAKVDNEVRDGQKEHIIEDKISEKNVKEEDLRTIKPGRDGQPKNPFRSRRILFNQ